MIYYSQVLVSTLLTKALFYQFVLVFSPQLKPTLTPDHRHSYLLDDGMVIIVWFGKLSRLTQQKKATLFAEKISNLERKNKSTYV